MESCSEFSQYLESSEYIDWTNAHVLTKAKMLSNGLTSDEHIARACFHFVRDEINHSWDYQQNPVTIRASEVLEHGTGYCYAKSHLLAALLRDNDIPAALCYQRLTIENGQPPFCLHGLNAVYLERYGWYRLDPRGNKPGIDAEFCPPREKLAFSPDLEGEIDGVERYREPLGIVIKALRNAGNCQDMAENLPDTLLI